MLAILYACTVLLSNRRSTWPLRFASITAPHPTAYRDGCAVFGAGFSPALCLDQKLTLARDLVNAITKPVNTAVFPEIRPKATDDVQSLLPLATEGVLRYVWESKFGLMLIEVMDGKTVVNGELVEPALP